MKTYSSVFIIITFFGIVRYQQQFISKRNTYGREAKMLCQCIMQQSWYFSKCVAYDIFGVVQTSSVSIFNACDTIRCFPTTLCFMIQSANYFCVYGHFWILIFGFRNIFHSSTCLKYKKTQNSKSKFKLDSFPILGTDIY